MIRLKSLLKEDDIVKNKKTGNVYVVKQMDPAKHDKPTPAEVDKAKSANGGQIPKGEQPSKPTVQQPQQQKPQGQKLSGGDFKSSAEKSPGKAKSDIPMLKDLMPNANFDRKPLSAVSPIERQQISTIIDKLAELGKQAKEKGEKSPNFNLCQVSVPGTNLYCDGNKGIPREDMPQFKGTPEPGSPADKLPKDENGEADTEEFFKQMLNKQGIKVSEPAAVPADRLKATQSELVGPKVAGMSKVLDDPNHPAYGKITAPIYVSNDGYVLDGHHRWAAVVAHNASNPDNQIPMNVRVIDEPIEPLVKRSNKFAEEIGIRAKKADTGAAGGPSPIVAPEKKKVNTKPSKRVSSEGEEMGTIQTKKGSTIFGVEHDNIEGAKQVVDDVKKIYPKDSKIVFLGEGGDENDVYVPGSEQEYIHNELKKHYPNFTNDSWDGKELDVHNDQSMLYKYQKKKTGLPHDIVMASNWANMVGQGEGLDTMNPSDYLTDGGRNFLQQSAKEAGLPPIKSFDKPSKRDIHTLYRLAYPQDNDDKKTKVGELSDAFNDARDENLIRKMKKYEDKGYKVVSAAGHGHIDLIKNRKQK
jgi:hypothetical protein